MDKVHPIKMFQSDLNLVKDITKNSSLGYLETLPITQYQEYYDAINENDTSTFDSFVRNSSTDTKSVLQYEFDFEDDEFRDICNSKSRVVLPFHLAVALSSPDVANLMLKQGADPFAVDRDGKNVLHSCVIIAFYQVIPEDTINNMIQWLADKMGDSLSKLLFHENADGLYPLELAAQQGCLGVMRKLLHLKGHVTKEVTRGDAIYKLHDVTAYESGERHLKSPLNMLAYLDHNKLKDPLLSTVILDPLILSWIDGKIKSNIFLLLLWFLMRLLIITIYLLADLDTSYFYILTNNNQTLINEFCAPLMHFHPGKWFGVTICITASILCFSILSIEIIAFARLFILKSVKKELYNCRGKKILIVNQRFYNILQYMFMVIFGAICSYYANFLLSDESIDPGMFAIMAALRVIMPLLMLWSLLYFMQLLPIIGPKIISLQSMLVDMGSFIVIAGICTLLFVHVFETYMLFNSNMGCIEEFSSPLQTWYTTFRMMLNMYDTTQHEINNRFVFKMLHILYVFMVGVMLINFLIAAMTESASKVARHEKVIYKINQLATVITLEEWVFLWFRPMYKKLRKLGFYVNHNGQCYLRSANARKKNKQM